MKAIVALISKSVLIAVTLASIGLIGNLVSNDPLPFIYQSPENISLAGVNVPLIDEREAFRLFNDPNTTFIDSRKYADYVRSHIKGAIFLPPEDIESRFQPVEPMIPQDGRIVLYCYGPECDMAEKVAMFLAQLGYRQMMIMTAGFPKWEKAKYPVESRATEDSKEDRLEDKRFENVLGDEVIVRKICSCSGISRKVSS